MESNDKKGRIPAIILGVIDIALLAGVIVLAAGGTVGTKKIEPSLEKNFVESPADYASEKRTAVKLSDITLGIDRKEEARAEEKKKAEEAQKKAQEEERRKAEEDQKKNSDTAESKKDPYEGFIFPESNKNIISDEQMAKKLSTKEKYLQAVNEIYARHGYAFKEEPFKSFFNRYIWYRDMKKVSMKTVEGALTKTERENLRNMLAFGREKGWR